MNRRQTPVDTETAVLTKCARRCTLCFYLACDLREKIGQIAHVDKDPSNFAEDNLAWMCLEHHTLFDSRTSQHKNYTMNEVKTARERLHEAIAQNRHASLPTITLPSNAQTVTDQCFFNQRSRLANNTVVEKIWQGPHWQIIISPTEFLDARFRNLAHCEQFMLGNAVRSMRIADCPTVRADALEEDEAGAWIAGELDLPEQISSGSILERWVLFRSGQFVYNRAFMKHPKLGNKLHYLEVARVITQVFLLTARMARDRILTPEAHVQFSLKEVAGCGLYIPDSFDDHWSRGKRIDVRRTAKPADLLARDGRDLALGVATEIYEKFGWNEPPMEILAEEQNRIR